MGIEVSASDQEFTEDTFVDSHFHLDRVNKQSRMDDLEEILANGPIPQTPMKLEAAIVNFIDGVPSRSVRRALSKDR